MRRRATTRRPAAAWRGILALAITTVAFLVVTSTGRALTDLPAHAPAAAQQPEAQLPTPTGWPFSNQAFPHTSGTGRLAGGADYWSDYLDDDQGTGSMTYPVSCGQCDGNGADIWRIGIGLDSRYSYWRVDWNTLASAKVPIAEFGLDLGGSTAGAPWPGGSGILTPAMQDYLLISGTGAWLIDGATGQRTAIAGADGQLSVDLAAQSFVVRVSRSLLPVSGTSTVRMIAGLANADGNGFENVSGLSSITGATPVNVYNVGFRSYAQESPGQSGGAAACTDQYSGCNDTAQAAALSRNDVTPFSTQVDWSQLAAGTTTPAPQPSGWTDRWYISSRQYGEGYRADPPTDTAHPSPPEFLGRVQPYGIYVPPGYHAGTPTPVVLAFHGTGQSQDDAYGNPECEGDAICIAPLERGAYGYCVGPAALDLWQAWHDVAAAYTLDPTRTQAYGVSMGGICTDYESLLHPDMFTAACDIEGVLSTPTNNPYGDLPTPGDPRLENLRWVPDYVAVGGADEFDNTSGILLQDHALVADGYRVRFDFFPASDHTTTPSEGALAGCAQYLSQAPTPAASMPGHVTYRWAPEDSDTALGLGLTGDYWLNAISARDPSLSSARIDAVSGADSDPAVQTTSSTHAGSIVAPYPEVTSEQDWTLGASPAPRPRITVALTNVATVAIDLAQAGFDRYAGDPGSTVAVTDDGASRITLDGAQPSSPVTLDGREVTRVGPSGTVTVTVPAGGSTIGFTSAGG